MDIIYGSTQTRVVNFGFNHGPQLDKLPQDYAPRHVSDYLGKFLDRKEFKELLKTAVKALRPDLDKFDAIAFTGMSGTLCAPALAEKLDKTLLMVRKSQEQIESHSYSEVEGDYNARSYIIVDDVTSTGSTKDRIIEKIAYRLPKAEYKGSIFLLALDYWKTKAAIEEGLSILEQ